MPRFPQGEASGSPQAGTRAGGVLPQRVFAISKEKSFFLFCFFLEGIGEFRD